MWAKLMCIVVLAAAEVMARQINFYYDDKCQHLASFVENIAPDQCAEGSVDGYFSVQYTCEPDDDHQLFSNPNCLGGNGYQKGQGCFVQSNGKSIGSAKFSGNPNKISMSETQGQSGHLYNDTDIIRVWETRPTDLPVIVGGKGSERVKRDGCNPQMSCGGNLCTDDYYVICQDQYGLTGPSSTGCQAYQSGLVIGEIPSFKVPDRTLMSGGQTYVFHADDVVDTRGYDVNGLHITENGGTTLTATKKKCTDGNPVNSGTSFGYSFNY